MYLVNLRNQSTIVRKKHILLSAVYATGGTFILL